MQIKHKVFRDWSSLWTLSVYMPVSANTVSIRQTFFKCAVEDILQNPITQCFFKLHVVSNLVWKTPNKIWQKKRNQSTKVITLHLFIYLLHDHCLPPQKLDCCAILKSKSNCLNLWLFVDQSASFNTHLRWVNVFNSFHLGTWQWKQNN